MKLLCAAACWCYKSITISKLKHLESANFFRIFAVAKSEFIAYRSRIIADP